MLSAPRYTVKELADQKVLRVEDGNHGEYRPRKNEFVTSGVAFIRAADLSDGGINFEAASKINEVALRRISKGIGKPRDVILSHKGTVGKVAIAPKDAPEFVCSPQTTFWRSLNHEVLDQDFLYTFIRSPDFKAQLDSRSGETDMAGYVSLTAQRSFWVPLPPIEEQLEIVSCISSIDSKIELNRRTNETLEAMARALFKSWFVDFDPVHAKAAGEAPAHMDAETAALFPDAFGEDGLPEGWHEEPLDQVADFLNGLALQKYPAEPHGPSLPVIKITELRSGPSAKSGCASMDVPPKYIVADGDVLFSWSGTLVTTLWSHGPGALNQHLFKVTSDRFPKWFYYLWVNHYLPEFRRIAASKATTMGHIQRGHLSAATVVVPRERLLTEMTAFMQPLVDKQIANSIENNTLAALRDLLLPKLMSGEIRVAEAEKAVAEAV